MQYLKQNIILLLLTCLVQLAVGQGVRVLKKGDLMPKYELEDTAGNSLNLSQFKGKYVFIDVWASYCYPCIKEYPFMAKIEEKLKDYQIVFVGISCDDVVRRWKEALGGYQLGGYQYLLKDKEFMKALKVDRIPRYILLDQKGKILELEMTRPSKPETEEYLTNLNAI